MTHTIKIDNRTKIVYNDDPQTCAYKSEGNPQSVYFGYAIRGWVDGKEVVRENVSYEEAEKNGKLTTINNAIDRVKAALEKYPKPDLGDPLENLLDRFISLRIYLRLSAREASRRLGLHENYVSRMERGEVEFRPVYYYALKGLESELYD